MKKLFKQITCFLLALMLCTGAVLVQPVQTKAAGDDAYTNLYGLPLTLEQSVAGVERTHTFTTKTTGPLFVDLYFQQPTAFSFQLKSSSGTVINYGSITETDEYWQALTEGTGYVYEIPYKSAAVGTFSFDVTTYVDTSYALVIDQGKPAASLSNTKMSITAGFTDKLTVQDASGKIKWSSSNKNIATVNAKGVVSAKKKGTCTITATTEDGAKLKCKINVKENVYTKTKVNNSKAEHNNVTAYIYKASLDSSGSLVCRFRVINNTNRTVKSLADMRIDVQNENEKTVYSYEIKSKSVHVPSYKYKDYTITIPKAKVKKCNLVKANIRFSGDYIS